MKTINHKDQVRLQREELILSVATVLLREQGYQGLNMQAIANQTDYSKGTIYQHFGCKEDVITKLVARCGEQLIHLMDSAIESGSGLREKVVLVSWAFFFNAEREPELTSLLSRVKSPDFQSKVSIELQAALAIIDQAILSRVVGLFANQKDVAPDKIQIGAFGWWAMKWGVQDVMANGWELSKFGFDNPKKFFFDSLHVFLDGLGVEQDDKSRDYEFQQKQAKNIFQF